MSLDVHPIVHELTEARHAAGSMNAATMTFVLFFDNEKIKEWVTERTRRVADKHPSRVIIFDATKPAGEQHAEPSSTRGEWIEIGVRDSNANEVSAALSMLALPEAPVVLVWVAEHIAGDERFLALSSLAQTVICNTSLTATDTRNLRELIAFVEGSPHIWLQDLSYIRLAAWQELIAEFFDEEPFSHELRKLTEVDVTAGSDPEMYYLLGWLASRLSWSPAGQNEFTNPHGPNVRFHLDHDGPPRRLTRIVLKSADVTFTAEVHPDDPSAVLLSVTGAKQRDMRCAPLHTMDIASMIEKAILTNRRDEVFIESLTTAKAIMERQ